jgi:hypothetical protein
MNNNFMVVNGPGNISSGVNSAGIHSGVGSVAMGQKTAYGFVGGINGQSINTAVSKG